MTPDQITRVEHIVERIAASDAFAVAFYDRLFEIAPDTQSLFPDLEGQRVKLRSELDTLVHMLRDLDRLEVEAGALGVRHRTYGVRAAHYRFARAAMAGAIADVLGDDFTADDQEAWSRAYDLVVELMQG